jgi:hypothetical protein
MCTTCHPLQKYVSVKSKQQLEELKQQAMNYVLAGHVSVADEIEYPGYSETSYLCKECGTKHVLWLTSDFLSHGGEWRTVENSLNLCTA